MKRTNYYLSEREIEFLRKQGEKQDLSASEILRRMIDWEIYKQEKRDKKNGE